MTSITDQNMYSLLEVQIIHTIGQCIDSYLFIYLVNHFFHPRKNVKICWQNTLIITILMAGMLSVVDLLSGNNFYAYYAAIFLLPILYCTLFFREKIAIKIAICSIFTLLILSFETLGVTLPYKNFYTKPDGSLLFLLLYSVRRIWIKIILYIIIKNLLIWPKKEDIQLPLTYWFLLLAVAAGDNFMLVVYHSPINDVPFLVWFTTNLFLVMIPIFLLIVMKYLALAAEKNKVASAQVLQAKIQNQYLFQQQEMVESLRKFRHDYKSHLFCIDTLLTAGKYDELHQYLLSLHKYQYQGIHLRRFVDDDSMNIILNQKATLAEKYGIRFETDIVLPSTGKIVMSDLNSLVVNLCDNAIEACATLDDAFILMSIHKVKAYLLIEVTNASNGNILEINPDLHTQKNNPEFHGIGIKIIKSITEKYNGQYQVSSTDHTFTTNLMLLDE